MKLTSKEFVDFIFAQDGLLSRFLPDYELRQEQRDMSQHILEAFENDKIALIEAGTGVGKSWAYLIPAIFWALKKGEQTVISTNTIPLQEQLIHKDIPFLLEALDVDIQAVLVKGMSNYLCLRKLEEVRSENLFFSQEEAEAFNKLEEWSQIAKEGSLSEVAFAGAASIWDKVAAERSSCTHVKCPHYKKCYFFKARKQIGEAQILIVNHHLLLADLNAKLQDRGLEEKSLLPKYQRLILDEAHHLEEIALDSFSRRMDRLDIVRWLGRIYSEHNPEKSRAVLLLKEMSALGVAKSSLTVVLETELPSIKRLAVSKLEELFRKVEVFCHALKEEVREAREMKWRLRAEHLLSHFWQTEIKPHFAEVLSGLNALAGLLSLIKKEVATLEKEVQEKLSVHMQEIGFIEEYILQKSDELGAFISDEEDIYRVRWVEITGSTFANTSLIDAHLNVAGYLKEHLFVPRLTTILCSATLASDGKFEYMKDRVGISGNEIEGSVIEKIYESPFDYQNRAVLAIPKDICFPTEPGFTKEAAGLIRQIVKASQGSALVLFTSYEMLNQCYQMLASDLKEFSLSKQGDASRNLLIERFKSSEGNVLFATDSFWEGVDIPGEALRCVILVKLPFRVPSDPLYQAFSEVYTKEGKDPFFGYSIPQASLKFKQGFGRLMRKKEDRGCVVCLDKRLIVKRYGSHFLKGIPKCKILFEPSSRLVQELKLFFSSTQPA